jgi:hypothetical protein
MSQPPTLTPSPNQFQPKRGRPANQEPSFEGALVRISGRNFSSGQLTVQFGDVNAAIVSRAPSKIEARVPEMAPGPCTITVKTGAGSVTSTDKFDVFRYPVLRDIDPFGFSRDPSEEHLIIAFIGDDFVLDEDDQVQVSCSLTPRPDPEVQVESHLVPLVMISAERTVITALVPAIKDFDRFIAGTGRFSIVFPDGAFLESEKFRIKGL